MRQLQRVENGDHVTVHTDSQGQTHGKGSQPVDKDGNCPGRGADNLDPATGKYADSTGEA